MRLSGRCTCCAIFVCSLLLQGCAGTQARPSDGLSDLAGEQNLDLLFATEYPVASRKDAIAKSNVALREGDVDKALFYSVKALKFDSRDTKMLMRIAQLHTMKQNDRIAARAFNLVLAQEPEHPEALQGLGILYFKVGDAPKARENLEHAVAADASLWQSWNLLGVLADERQEFSMAADCYEKALSIRADAVSVQINRGYSLYLAGDLQGAARNLFDVAERSGHPTAWRDLGMVYARMGWYEEAVGVFRKVDSEANAFNRTGEIALETGDLDVAYDCFMEAIKHAPVYFAEAEQNLLQVKQKRSITAANR